MELGQNNFQKVTCVCSWRQESWRCKWLPSHRQTTAWIHWTSVISVLVMVGLCRHSLSSSSNFRSAACPLQRAADSSCDALNNALSRTSAWRAAVEPCLVVTLARSPQRRHIVLYQWRFQRSAVHVEEAELLWASSTLRWLKLMNTWLVETAGLLTWWWLCFWATSVFVVDIVILNCHC